MSDFVVNTLKEFNRLSFVVKGRELVFMSPGAFKHWAKQSLQPPDQPLISMPCIDRMFEQCPTIDLHSIVERANSLAETVVQNLSLMSKEGPIDAELQVDITLSGLVIVVLKRQGHISNFEPINEQQLLQSIISHAPVGIWYINNDGDLSFFNRDFVKTVEQNKDDFLNITHYSKNLPLALAEGCMASDMLVMRSGQTCTAKEYVRLSNGQLKFLEITKVPLLTPDGNIRGIIGITADLTEQQQIKNDLIREKDRAIVTLSAIGDGVITTDKNGVIDYMNPAAERLIHWPAKQAIGLLVNDVFRCKNMLTRALQPIAVEQYLKPGTPLNEHCRSILMTRNDKELLIQESVASIHDHNNRPTGLVITFKDNTETKKLTDRLEHYSKHDTLTGLLNRQELCRIIDNEIKCSADNTLFLLIDIDQFKIIINTAGNSAGNFLLKFISNILSDIVEKNDYLGRLSSDVFGLILSDMNEDKARAMARRVAQTFKDNPFTWKDRQYNLTSSIGVVPINRQTSSVDDVISQAHLACYAAKDSGRGHFHVYNADDQPTFRMQDELALVQDIDQALRNNAFELYCQPIISLKDNSLKRIEILIRMRNTAGNIVMPSHFIPVAEHYGFMPNIDTWVLDHLVAYHYQSFLNRPDLYININLSGRSLSNKKLLRNIHYFLLKNPTIAHRLCFEITETAAIKELNVALAFMNSLRGLGCQLALDDFGSGLSSFRYLKTLPVDILKIDGSFIINMDEDATDLAMVNSINDVCRAMGIQVVAEYVETKALEDLVKALDIDYAQGFYYSKPVRLQEYLDQSP